MIGYSGFGTKQRRRLPGNRGECLYLTHTRLVNRRKIWVTSALNVVGAPTKWDSTQQSARSAHCV